MKKAWIIMALLLLVGLPIRCAFALSQQSAPQNIDGTPKFTDPDEQMPGFVVGSEQDGTGARGFSGSASNVTIPSMGDRDYGAQAFDQAFSHQQSKE